MSTINLSIAALISGFKKDFCESAYPVKQIRHLARIFCFLFISYLLSDLSLSSKRAVLARWFSAFCSRSTKATYGRDALGDSVGGRRNLRDGYQRHPVVITRSTTISYSTAKDSIDGVKFSFSISSFAPDGVFAGA